MAHERTNYEEFDTLSDDSTLSREIVYHYTSPNGLLGIIDNPMTRIGGTPSWLPSRDNLLVLNASDVRYMNDSRELRMAGDLVAERLRERLDELDPATDPLARAAAESALETIDAGDMPFGGAHRVFAVCFCSDGDLLSQWRGYAGNLGGYAIGIRRNLLRFGTNVKVGEWPALPPLVPTGAALVKVEYGNHGRLTDSFVSSIISTAREQAGIARAIPPLFGNMSRFAQYKDESFKEEQEWRLVYEGVPIEGYSMPVLFRARADGIVPYLPIVVGTPAAGSFDINPHGIDFDEVVADLVVGPGPDMALRVDAAKSVLHRNGHNPDVVRESRVPFKG